MVFSVPLRLALCLFIFCIWAEATLSWVELKVLLNQVLIAENWPNSVDTINISKKQRYFNDLPFEVEMTEKTEHRSDQYKVTENRSDQYKVTETVTYPGKIKTETRYDMAGSAGKHIEPTGITFTAHGKSKEFSVILKFPQFSKEEEKMKRVEDDEEKEKQNIKRHGRTPINVSGTAQSIVKEIAPGFAKTAKWQTFKKEEEPKETHYVFLNENKSLEAVVSNKLRPHKGFVSYILTYGEKNSEYTLRRLERSGYVFFVVTKEMPEMRGNRLAEYKLHPNYKTYLDKQYKLHPYCKTYLDKQEASPDISLKSPCVEVLETFGLSVLFGYGLGKFGGCYARSPKKSYTPLDDSDKSYSDYVTVDPNGLPDVSASVETSGSANPGHLNVANSTRDAS